MAQSDIVSACRSALRIPASCPDYDAEIEDLVEAARARMRAGGVAAEVAEDDSLGIVRVAIKCYVKGGFGLDNPDAELYGCAFDSLVTQMKATSEFGGAS